MAIGSARSTINLEDILKKTTEFDILHYYLNICTIPILINSPIRNDKTPSFGLYSFDGKIIYYKDWATKETGGIFELLSKLWNCTYLETLIKIYKDLEKINSYKSSNINVIKNNNITVSKLYSDSKLECKVRKWRDYDIEYWNSYGISLQWLKYAEVYPISHKIIIKNNNKHIFVADKYAYAYVERKEGNITLKIYQPFNTQGYKWSNKHNSSTISLWTKIPKTGNVLCICSSLKDALCLWANTNIPSIATQGEGYSISNTAINNLKERFKYIYILYDNDSAGLQDGIKLAESTGFINIILPNTHNTKDISDLYKKVGKDRFKDIILPLFKLNNK